VRVRLIKPDYKMSSDTKPSYIAAEENYLFTELAFYRSRASARIKCLIY